MGMPSAPISVYCRVSVVGEREGERFQSVPEQVERATAYVHSLGYAVGPTFTDLDVSGAASPWDRPAMSAALRLIERGESGGLAAMSLDRFSRTPADGDALLKFCADHGALLLAPDIPLDVSTSPSSEMVFGMLMTVSRWQRSQAKARWAASKQRAARRGVKPGNLPFGFVQEEGTGRMTIEPGQADIVRRLFELRAEGASGRQLAAFMREATGRNTWVRQSIDAILGNHLYHRGRLVYDGVEAETDAGAIVSFDLWSRAQKAPGVQARSRQKTLLAGLAVCAGCGRNLSPWKPSSKSSRGSNRRYKCQSDGRCSEPASVAAPWLDEYVTTAAFQEDLRMTARSPESRPDLAVLERAQLDAQRRYDQAMSPDAQDALQSAWSGYVRARREELEAAAAALAEAQEHGPAPERELMLGAVWDDMAPADQKDALRYLYERVVVHRADARGADPRVELVLRETRPGWRWEYRPVELLPTDWTPPS
jgi:DNA invertase Pin-like site-specific DNA recombinase